MDTPRLTGLNAMLWIWRFFRDPIGSIESAHQQFGPTVAVGPVVPWQRSRRRFILALGAEYNRIVFGDPTAFRTTGQMRTGGPDSAIRRIRNGLTAMNGAKHRQQRALIAPFFSKKAIDQYCIHLVETADETLRQWPVGTTADIAELYQNLMLRLSGRALFARESTKRLDELGVLFHKLIVTSPSPWVQLLPFNIPGLPYHWLLRHAGRLEAYLLEIIRERRAKPMPEGGDMLDHLVHARDADNTVMTDADLLGQASILFGASYETQSKVMIWTSLLLAQHPNVQRRLMAELDSVLGGRTPTIEQMEHLPYLEAVVNESMRILPPVPYTLRRSTVEIDMHGTPVHEGDWVILSHYITHRCPKLYPQPRRFIPERWFSIKPTQYEFVPFSAGPRWCIGKPLAMTMMKLTLAMVMQRFRMTVQPGARVDRLVRVTMSPRLGLPMTLMPQDRQFQAMPLTGNVAAMVDWTDEPVESRARAA